MTSALREAGTCLLIIALIALMYLRDRRKQRREAERREWFREQRAARYHELEFQVAPTPFDWQADVDWEEAA